MKATIWAQTRVLLQGFCLHREVETLKHAAVKDFEKEQLPIASPQFRERENARERDLIKLSFA
jgi:hypothetical protein